MRNLNKQNSHGRPQEIYRIVVFILKHRINPPQSNYSSSFRNALHIPYLYGPSHYLRFTPFYCTFRFPLLWQRQSLYLLLACFRFHGPPKKLVIFTGFGGLLVCLFVRCMYLSSATRNVFLIYASTIVLFSKGTTRTWTTRWPFNKLPLQGVLF